MPVMMPVPCVKTVQLLPPLLPVSPHTRDVSAGDDDKIDDPGHPGQHTESSGYVCHLLVRLWASNMD